MSLGSDGDFPVVTDAHLGLLAPDEGPPRTMGIGAQDGSFFCEGLLLSGVGCLSQFTMDFVLIGVGDELVEQMVCPGEFDDLVGDQEGDEAFLPVVMAAFDFAFGLRGGGEAQCHALVILG